MNKLYKVGIIIPLLAVIIIPMMGVIANAAKVAPSTTPPIEDLADVESLLTAILGWINTFFYIIASIFILFAAFQYLTAAGDEEKVKKAKNMLIYAVIAIAIALFAGGLDVLIENIITTT